MSERKMRSRAYPVIPLQEAVDLLGKISESTGWGPRDRDVICRVWGYASGKIGIAARKIAALSHFGLLDVQNGLYAPTPLARRIREEDDEIRLRTGLREACLSPSLFQEIVHRYELVGRVPRQLATALSLDHGIQESVQEEVTRIFMASAKYAGILDADGVFREEYFEEARRPRPFSRSPIMTATQSGASFDHESGAIDSEQVLRFNLTDQKLAEFRLPSRLNEQDIRLLKAQVGFLELQVQLNRPDQPVRLDLVREKRGR